MNTSSFWVNSVRLPRFGTLSENLHVDVVVIGAGITGVTTAYLLKKAGRTVALLERGRCGGIDSPNTTAHLTYVTDLRLHQLVKNFGKEQARAVWQAGQAAIDQIVANIAQEKIRCEFTWVPGYLHAPLRGQTAADRQGLDEDARLAQELGFRAEFMAAVPFFGVPGVRFDCQAKFHPLKYLAALLRTIPGDGSYVFERTEVEEVQKKSLATKAGHCKVRCRYVVLATHTPLMGKTNIVSATLFQSKLALYTSYALGARLPAGALPEALFWDTGDPYYYLRVDRRRGFDLAIFGGEDHKTGQNPHTERSYGALQKTLLNLIPQAKVRYRWSGQVIETNDGLPLIGETSSRQFAATGFAGNGMTFGTLGAMMAVDAFLKRKNPWSGLLSTKRRKLRGGTASYLAENSDYPFYLVRDRIDRAEGKSLNSVRRKQGKILHLHGKKVAAYRNASGDISLRSPVCTHLGCIVAWNEAEQTWDCPCHGSRFKPTGEVVSGPAEEDLAPIESSEKK